VKVEGQGYEVPALVAVMERHPNGLPLEPGFVEVVTAQTTVAGQRHDHLAGHEGKIAVRSWQGAIDGIAPFDDPAQVSGVDWILAENWMPYQLISFVTPPFPGYVSGHSTFSRTAADILTRFTGAPFFPGGLGEYDIEAGAGLDFEFGPVEPMSLQWATYFDASDQGSISRVFGGIHPPADDLAGRQIGQRVGISAWEYAQKLYSGIQVPELPSNLLLVIAMSLTSMLRHHLNASPRAAKTRTAKSRITVYLWASANGLSHRHIAGGGSLSPLKAAKAASIHGFDTNRIGSYLTVESGRLGSSPGCRS
jgi:hypothetical protein